jgi:alpha,alpha-trehalase
MFVPFHDDGIISQFEGYEKLEELDWEGYRERYGDIHRLDRILEAENDTPNRYKVSKQADVLMLFYLLSCEELGELLERLGYELGPSSAAHHRLLPRAHLARLDAQRVVHAWVLTRAQREGGWRAVLPRRCAPTSPTSRAARRTRASTSPPWPAASTCCSAASPGSRPGRTD